jgi:hypothetical protein
MWAFWALACFWVIVAGVVNVAFIHNGGLGYLILIADGLLLLGLVFLAVGDLRHRRRQRLD